MRSRSLSLFLCVGAIALTACNGGSNSDAGSDVSSTDATDTFTSDDSVNTDDSDTSNVARDFTLHARAMDSFVGHALGAWVVETTGGHEIGYAQIASINGAEFDLRLPDLAPEGDYRADVFVDSNDNGSYDANDPSWPITIPGQGSATAMLAGTDPTMSLSSVMRIPRTDFTAMLSGFTADEAGHWFELRVIDQSSNATVGGYVQPQLPANGTVTITLPGVLDDGSTYNVDFWVDMDGDNAYGGPSVDHTWRAMLQGSTLTWTHTDEYTELDWR